MQSVSLPASSQTGSAPPSRYWARKGFTQSFDRGDADLDHEGLAVGDIEPRDDFQPRARGGSAAADEENVVAAVLPGGRVRLGEPRDEVRVLILRPRARSTEPADLAIHGDRAV